MESETFTLITIFMVIFAILSFTGLIIAGVYFNYELKIDNFQTTIDDLSDEQKCLHICGFQWPGSVYFDNYKFCVEKCDRISERDCVKVN